MNLRKPLNTVLLAATACLAAGSAQAAACLTSDVSLVIASTTYAPSACRDNINQGGGPVTETTALNTAFGNSYTYLDSSDDASTPTGIGGVRFVVTAPPSGTTNAGAWSISWSEQPGSPNLPLYISFEVALFGGNNGSGYLFNNVLLTSSPTSGSGSFDINFLNNGNQQPALSHLLIAGGDTRACTGNCNSEQVPAPGALSLLGLGLVGLALTRKRAARQA